MAPTGPRSIATGFSPRPSRRLLAGQLRTPCRIHRAPLPRRQGRHLSRAIGNPRTNRLNRRKLVGAHRETEQRPSTWPLLRRQPLAPARSRHAPGRPPPRQPRRLPGAVGHTCQPPHEARVARGTRRIHFRARQRHSSNCPGDAAPHERREFTVPRQPVDR